MKAGSNLKPDLQTRQCFRRMRMAPATQCKSFRFILLQVLVPPVQFVHVPALQRPRRCGLRHAQAVALARAGGTEQERTPPRITQAPGLQPDALHTSDVSLIRLSSMPKGPNAGRSRRNKDVEPPYVRGNAHTPNAVHDVTNAQPPHFKICSPSPLKVRN